MPAKAFVVGAVLLLLTGCSGESLITIDSSESSSQSDSGLLGFASSTSGPRNSSKKLKKASCQVTWNVDGAHTQSLTKDLGFGTRKITTDSALKKYRGTCENGLKLARNVAVFTNTCSKHVGQTINFKQKFTVYYQDSSQDPPEIKDAYLDCPAPAPNNAGTPPPSAPPSNSDPDPEGGTLSTPPAITPRVAFCGIQYTVNGTNHSIESELGLGPKFINTDSQASDYRKDCQGWLSGLVENKAYCDSHPGKTLKWLSYFQVEYSNGNRSFPVRQRSEVACAGGGSNQGLSFPLTSQCHYSVRAVPGKPSIGNRTFDTQIPDRRISSEQEFETRKSSCLSEARAQMVGNCIRATGQEYLLTVTLKVEDQDYEIPLATDEPGVCGRF